MGSRTLHRPGSDIRLGRHQTFHLRAGWLVKALHSLVADPEALSGPGSHHNLGVGKNMVEAIRYWVIESELATVIGKDPESRRTLLGLTEFGELLLRRDPFLEDVASLWAIHIALASNERAPAWYWLFNEADGFELSEAGMFAQFSAWLADAAPGGRFSEPQIRRELSCLRRTYVPDGRGATSSSLDDQLTCPLAALGLVKKSESGTLQLRVGPKPNIPPEIVVFALQRFANENARATFSVDDLRWDRRSPGRMLGLDTGSLLKLLLELQSHRRSGVYVTQTAGLRSVSLVPGSPIEALERYFARTAA